MLENMDLTLATGGTNKKASRADTLRQRWYVCDPTHKTLLVAVTGDLRAYAPVATTENAAAALILTVADAAQGGADAPNGVDLAKARKW
jgi:hypothetical protein